MTAGRSAILTYHSLDDSGSVLSMPPSVFRRQMEFLASSSIPVVPLDEAVRRPNCIALTFDDGFRNLLDHAIPVLDRLRLPATIFVVSGYCGGLNDCRASLPAVPAAPDGLGGSGGAASRDYDGRAHGIAPPSDGAA